VYIVSGTGSLLVVAALPDLRGPGVI